MVSRAGFELGGSTVAACVLLGGTWTPCDVTSLWSVARDQVEAAYWMDHSVLAVHSEAAAVLLPYMLGDVQPW